MQSAAVVQDGFSHAVLCGLAILPDGHSAHSVLPRTSAKRPASHSVHVPLAPNLPRSHLVHSEEPFRPFVVVPLGHAVQFVCASCR